MLLVLLLLQVMGLEIPMRDLRLMDPALAAWESFAQILVRAAMLALGREAMLHQNWGAAASLPVVGKGSNTGLSAAVASEVAGLDSTLLQHASVQICRGMAAAAGSVQQHLEQSLSGSSSWHAQVISAALQQVQVCACGDQLMLCACYCFAAVDARCVTMRWWSAQSMCASSSHVTR